MKKIYFALAILILILQARLLSSEGGLGELFLLQEQLKKLETTVEIQRVINENLTLQVEALQQETASIETIARQTLGMVKKHEVFIKVIELKQPEPVVELAAEPEVVAKSEDDKVSE